MKKMILDQTEIQVICQSIGEQLNQRFKDVKKPVIVMGVMKGALPFMCDVVKHLTFPLVLDFIQVSSYEGLETTGKIHLKKEPEEILKDRDIIVIEDIVDTGITFHYLADYLRDKQPATLCTVTLLDKKCRRKVPFQVDYVGKEIENEFVVGYGLDYNEQLRNIPYIYVPTTEEIARIDQY